MTTGLDPRADGSLQILNELLVLVSRKLEVRELFAQMSAAFRRVLQFDEARLALLEGEGAPSVYVCSEDGTLQDTVEDTAHVLAGAEPQLLDVAPASGDDLPIGLKVPVRSDDRVVGMLALSSRNPAGYTPADLLVAQWLANALGYGLSYRRLVEQARDAAVLQERSAHIEGSVELLRTIADVLDIRTVFARISEIVAHMLPHDAMAMVFVDQDRHFVRQAHAPDDFPDPPFVTHDHPFPRESIITDISTEPLPIFEPADAFAPVIAAGYRSFMSVRVPARDQVIELTFWSKQPGVFTALDLPTARRIADYIALSVSHEQLVEADRQAAEAQARAERLEARVQMLSEQLESKAQIRVVGDSAEWRDVLKRATQVAETDTTVLVTGESGTGKEVVARFIHRASPRSRGPFVALNCAALPEQLLESELFGYERGAFTGAQQSKLGQIEIASGGVLFLDEVTEMSLAAQAKFLRVLQEREFQRLGGTRTTRANIRVIAATNRDLRKAVERGDFREDLFYRLKVFDIAIPPLRERSADILPLSDTLLQDIGKSFARPPAGLTRDAREALLRHHWPGNVRELRNALERAAILCEGGLIGPEHLALEAAGRPPGPASTDLSAIERQTIAQVLVECRWNRTRAAKRLGLTRTQLYLRLQKYGLEKPPDA